jgi:hypothetical protein
MSQSAARSLFRESVARKRSIEQRNIDLGMQIKSDILRKHSGREQMVRNEISRKLSMNEFHLEQVAKRQDKNKELSTAR